MTEDSAHSWSEGNTARYDQLFGVDGVGSPKVQLCELPPLVCPTGRIVATDPAVGPDSEPSEAVLPPGRHQATIALAEWIGTSRPAAVRIMIDGAAPVRFEWADTVFVDSGVASFGDERAFATVLERMEADSEYVQELGDALFERPDGQPWANVVVDEGSGANLLLFTSGAGDGSYTTWAGYDSAGRVVCLVVDFELL